MNLGSPKIKELELRASLLCLHTLKKASVAYNWSGLRSGQQANWGQGSSADDSEASILVSQ